jgi:hypothetical protein
VNEPLVIGVIFHLASTLLLGPSLRSQPARRCLRRNIWRSRGTQRSRKKRNTKRAAAAQGKSPCCQVACPCANRRRDFSRQLPPIDGKPTWPSMSGARIQ